MAVLMWIQAHIAAPWLDTLMVIITKSGDLAAVWFILAALLCLKREHRSLGLRVIVALLLSVLLCNALLKPLFHRLRPFELVEYALLIPVPHGSSFPSGHSCASFAAACALWRGPRRLFAPALVYAAAIAFSRMYLFVHFPGDVLGGALLGAAIGVAADAWLRRKEIGGKLLN